MQGNCHGEDPVTNLLALNKRAQGNARILANSGEGYHVVPYICITLLERLTSYTAMGYRTNLPSSPPHLFSNNRLQELRLTVAPYFNRR